MVIHFISTLYFLKKNTKTKKNKKNHLSYKLKIDHHKKNRLNPQFGDSKINKWIETIIVFSTMMDEKFVDGIDRGIII